MSAVCFYLHPYEDMRTYAVLSFLPAPLLMPRTCTFYMPMSSPPLPVMTSFSDLIFSLSPSLFPPM